MNITKIKNRNWLTDDNLTTKMRIGGAHLLSMPRAIASTTCCTFTPIPQVYGLLLFLNVIKTDYAKCETMLKCDKLMLNFMKKEGPLNVKTIWSVVFSWYGNNISRPYNFTLSIIITFVTYTLPLQ